MRIVVHLGVVWCYQISGGWYTHLRPFPMAMKKDKDDYVPDINHASVLEYLKKTQVLLG